jgi:hypothetical protein
MPTTTRSSAIQWSVPGEVKFGLQKQERLRIHAAHPRPKSLSPLPAGSLRRAHNTRRYGHYLAGGPGRSDRGREGLLSTVVGTLLATAQELSG